jgi:hypothetical protein
MIRIGSDNCTLLSSSGFVETDMNLYRSLRNHKNLNINEDFPPQGLSEARRGISPCSVAMRSAVKEE